MPKIIPGPDFPERGSCDPAIKRDPLRMPKEVPEPVVIPQEEPIPVEIPGIPVGIPEEKWR